MLLPRIWDEDLFENMDNWMSWPDESEFFGKKNPLYGKHAKNLMKTDVRETEDAYEVDIDLPGFKKDEVTITVENGYLNISAVKGLDKDETDKKTGKYIRQERYAGSCSRTFYVGEAVEPEDVSAKFENGILQLHILKKEAKKVEKKDNRIAIEGCLSGIGAEHSVKISPDKKSRCVKTYRDFLSYKKFQFHTIKTLWEDPTAAGKEKGDIRQEKCAGFHPKGCVKRLNHVKQSNIFEK